MKKVTCLVMLVLFGVTVCSYALEPVTPLDFEPPAKYIQVEEKYFDDNFKGLKQYVDSLAKAHPSMYQALQPDFKAIETKMHNSAFSFIGGVLLGGLLTIGSVTFLAEKKSEQIGASSKNIETTIINEPLLYAGFGVLLAGGTAAYFLRPSKEDFKNFKDKHNQLNPETPMNIQLGLDIQPGKQLVVLTYKF